MWPINTRGVKYPGKLVPLIRHISICPKDSHFFLHGKKVLWEIQAMITWTLSIFEAVGFRGIRVTRKVPKRTWKRRRLRACHSFARLGTEVHSLKASFYWSSSYSSHISNNWVKMRLSPHRPDPSIIPRGFARRRGYSHSFAISSAIWQSPSPLGIRWWDRRSFLDESFWDLTTGGVAVWFGNPSNIVLSNHQELFWRFGFRVQCPRTFSEVFYSRRLPLTDIAKANGPWDCKWECIVTVIHNKSLTRDRHQNEDSKRCRGILVASIWLEDSESCDGWTATKTSSAEKGLNLKLFWDGNPSWNLPNIHSYHDSLNFLC